MQKLTAGDPETQSTDLTAENIARLREIFPEAFTEGRIDFDVLKQLLGDSLDEREEKYGLNWHGKRRARQIALTPSTGTLRPCPEESVDWDTTQNLMIEGDNLEVLKLLQKSYAGKVKLIYIDPPYNTGKDFVYPDNFQDNIRNYLEITGQVDGEGQKVTSNTEASGRFHTDWMNMMYPRLKLARNLLSEDGVILISIDDNELCQLRSACNDVFGEENFIACLVWERGRKNDARRFSVGHEYILVFAKHLAWIEHVVPAWREPKQGVAEIVEEYHRLKDVHGSDFVSISEGLVEFYKSLPAEHPSKTYSRSRFVDRRGIWRDNNISWPGGGGPRYDVLHPETKQPCRVPDDGWRFIESTMKEKIRDGYVEFREDHTKSPFLKSYLYLDDDSDSSDEDSAGEKRQVMPSVFYRHSQPAADSLKELFSEKIFENPKDHTVLMRLIRYLTGPSDIVMDFFAGSGTTGHAVLELNHLEQTARRYILVQIPEPTGREEFPYISDITRERLRRVAAKLKSTSPLLRNDLGFRVFKLHQSNIRTWDPNRDDLPGTLLDSIEHIRPDRSEQDILFELLLKLGLDLTVPIESQSIAGKTVHSIGAGTLLVCLDPKISRKDTEPLALGIVNWWQQLAPTDDDKKARETRLVFRDSAFADDVAKTNLMAILEQHGLTNVRSL